MLAFAPGVGPRAAGRGVAARVATSGPGVRRSAPPSAQASRRWCSTACSARRCGTRPLVDRVGEVTSDAGSGGRGSAGGAAQLPLAAVPAAHAEPRRTCFPGTPPIDFWMRNLMGRFGWLDYDVPGVDVPVGRRRVLDRRSPRWRSTRLIQRRGALCPRLPEIAAYALMGDRLPARSAVAGYIAWVTRARRRSSRRGTCCRCCRCTRSSRRSRSRSCRLRWQPVLGALLVAGVLIHGVVAQIATLQRYYG